MKLLLQKSFVFFSLLFAANFIEAQTTNTYNASTTWTVPAGVTTIIVEVFGGAGGTGGLDCGSGCTHSLAGTVGHVFATYTVVPGNVVGIYPGGKGGDGGDSKTGAGGGAAGVASFSSSYNGGTGGNAGSLGSSGGGGGGGGASVLSIAGVTKIVAGGGAGGGGMADAVVSGLTGNATTSSNGTNTGGNGTNAGSLADGGGGGGGGGGDKASAGGTTYALGGFGSERAGNGGFRGNNSVSGAATTSANNDVAWTSGGQIKITFSILPLTWLSFTATKQNNTALLQWSTATEQNTKDFVIQRSHNAVDWFDIGTVTASGNSSLAKYYQFTDAAPFKIVNYYRIMQRDLNGNATYTNKLLLKFDEEGTLKIYPNPVVNGNAVITLQENAIVKVYNSIGALVLLKEFTAGNHQLNVSTFAKGTYYIKTNTGAAVFLIQ